MRTIISGRVTVALLALFLLTQASAVASAERRWKVSGGADYSSGDYGDAIDTRILYLPVAISYRRGAWKTRLSVPWLRISGPGSVIGGGDGAVVLDGSGVSDDRQTASGPGDIWLSETYAVPSAVAGFLYFDLTGKLKLPVADEDEGLGTGERDYTLQVDAFAASGRLTPMLRLAYKIKGDPPGFRLKNVWYLSVGADYRLEDGFNVGATLDTQQASTAGGEDIREIFAYVDKSLTAAWSGMVYGYKGLADGSPDYGIGLQLSYRF